MKDYSFPSRRDGCALQSQPQEQHLNSILTELIVVLINLVLVSQCNSSSQYVKIITYSETTFTTISLLSQQQTKTMYKLALNTKSQQIKPLKSRILNSKQTNTITFLANVVITQLLKQFWSHFYYYRGSSVALYVCLVFFIAICV